jgi:hypothetical protein
MIGDCRLMESVLEFLQRLVFISAIIGLTLKAYRFLRRVRDQIRQPMGLQGVRVLGLWTWLVFIPSLLFAFGGGLIVALLTKSIEASLGAFALFAGFSVTIWLMPFIAPVLRGTIQDALG